MRIRRVEVATLDIPLREPLVSGSLRWDRRRVALVTIHTDAGWQGLAEFAAPEPDGLGQPVGPQLAAELEGIHLADPVALEGALRRIDRWPFVGPVARSGIESAMVDLLARAQRLTVAASLAPAPAGEVAVNALLGIAEPAHGVAWARNQVEAGFRCLKLKAGPEAAAVLAARVGAVRNAVGPDIRIRLDFNGSLEPRSAGLLLEALAVHDIEYVEQPLPPTIGVAVLARLRRDSPIPIAADESVRDMRSARELLEAGAADVLVVKPARVGGLRQARSIVELASDAGAAVTVSTLLETGVGIAGALHLAAGVPGDRAHGLATSPLLAADLLVAPLPIVAGRMPLPAGPGLGIELDGSAVERYRAA